jgi:hypothetical protein
MVVSAETQQAVQAATVVATAAKTAAGLMLPAQALI